MSQTAMDNMTSASKAPTTPRALGAAQALVAMPAVAAAIIHMAAGDRDVTAGRASIIGFAVIEVLW
jgi:hypothetical protein